MFLLLINRHGGTLYEGNLANIYGLNVYFQSKMKMLLICNLFKRI